MRIMLTKRLAIVIHDDGKYHYEWRRTWPEEHGS